MEGLRGSKGEEWREIRMICSRLMDRYKSTLAINGWKAHLGNSRMMEWMMYREGGNFMTLLEMAMRY